MWLVTFQGRMEYGVVHANDFPEREHTQALPFIVDTGEAE